MKRQTSFQSFSLQLSARGEAHRNTEKSHQRVYSSNQKIKNTIYPYLVVCSGLYGAGNSSFPQGFGLMRQLEQIFPLWSLPVDFAPVELGSQMFACSQQLCQDGQLTDTADPSHFHTVVGGNACTKADKLRTATGSATLEAPSLTVTCPVEEARGVEQSGVDLTRPPVHQLPTHIHTHVFRPQPGAQPIGAHVQFPSAV